MAKRPHERRGIVPRARPFTYRGTRRLDRGKVETPWRRVWFQRLAFERASWATSSARALEARLARLASRRVLVDGTRGPRARSVARGGAMLSGASGSPSSIKDPARERCARGRRCSGYGPATGMDSTRPRRHRGDSDRQGLLGRGRGRRGLHLRRRPIRGLGRKHAAREAHRRHRRDPVGNGYWLVGSRRRCLLVRRRRVPRFDRQPLRA